MRKLIGRLTLSTLGLLLVAFSIPFAMSPAYGKGESCKLRIHVSGVKNNLGKVRLAVFNHPDKKFPNESRAIRRMAVPALSGKTDLDLSLPCGSYAIAVYHDENGNGVHDKNMLGIPVEGYGFSNNPDSQYGPPPYAKATFELTGGGQAMEIHLLYLMD